MAKRLRKTDSVWHDPVHDIPTDTTVKYWVHTARWTKAASLHVGDDGRVWFQIDGQGNEHLKFECGSDMNFVWAKFLDAI
jgi:hypothetical protein